MNRRRIGAGAALVMALLLGAAPPAYAQKDVDPVAKATARDLAKEGLALFDRGSYLPALDKFDRAAALFPAPTMHLMAARCLAKLGRLVEAAERYLVASRIQLAKDASEAFKTAVADAAAEHEALVPKIPRLLVGLGGPNAREIEVTIDGKPIPAAMIGVPRPTDPGHHTLQAKRGAEVVVKQIDLKEGESIEVPMTVNGGGIPKGDGGALGDPGSGQRMAGWVLLGVGAAGLVTGAVTGGLAAAAESNLINNDHCVAGVGCPNSAQGDLSAYNRLRYTWISSVSVGGAAALTGVVLVLTAPRATRAASGRLPFQPWVGLQSAGVRGEF